mmetsp:Transcript_28798/g.37834  ORF Transcript_28798/g.37834 Transcript_28798/m.37834 type:complete len:95 (+) Transcript_28798:3-287(+)
METFRLRREKSKKMQKQQQQKEKMLRCKGDEECKKVPRFNLVGSKEGMFCRLHKTSEMVDLWKICSKPKCKRRARFNEEGKDGDKFCEEHKLEC